MRLLLLSVLVVSVLGAEKKDSKKKLPKTKKGAKTHELGYYYYGQDHVGDEYYWSYWELLGATLLPATETDVEPDYPDYQVLCFRLLV